MRRSRRKRQNISLPEVSLTPLIDTALTLLIIFMIATPMMTNVIKVQLPGTKTNEQEKNDKQPELIVSIDKNNKLFLDKNPITEKKLLQKLKEHGKNHKNSIVFVRGDTGSKYGAVIKLVDTIKTAGGVEYVALATKRIP